MREVLVVTTNDVPGYKVVEVYGEVFGLIVRSRNLQQRLLKFNGISSLEGYQCVGD